MRPARAYYLLHFAALAALIPYLSVYFASRGLSGVEIGFLMSLIPLMTVVGAPFWTEVADTTGRHKQVLIALVVVVVLAAVGLSLASSVLWLALFTALFAFHLAPSMPLLDHAVLEALGDRAQHYGRQRVWGTYGWGIVAPAAGWVASQHGLSWSFILFLAMMPWVIVAASRVKFAAVTAAGTRRIGGGLALVLQDSRWIPFLVTGFTGGLGLATIGSFLPLHLRDLGGSFTVIGVAMAVPALSEIPFMLFGGALLAGIGARKLLIFAIGMMALRLLLTGLLQDYASVAAVQILHGPSFAVLWIAGVSYARELAPAGRRAVAQGLFAAVTSGLGSFIGNISGGAIYDAWGGSAVFLLGAAVMAAAALLLTLWRPPAAAPR